MVRWIHTGGGPFVLASAERLMTWKGIGTGRPDCDYQAACEIQDYLGVMTRGGGQFLVLGDEPLQTTFVRDKKHWLLARWESCESEAMAEIVLAAIPPSLPALQPMIDFLLEKSPAVLLDAAAIASMADIAAAPQAHLPPGRYRVTTETYVDPGRFAFVLHRFVLQNLP